MDTSLMVRGFVLNSLVVDVEEGDQEEEEEEGLGVVVVVAVVVDEALLHVALSIVSWFPGFPLLVVGKISKTICVMLVMFNLPMSLKMVLVLWSILAMRT